jgi:hypothetical protein
VLLRPFPVEWEAQRRTLWRYQTAVPARCAINGGVTEPHQLRASLDDGALSETIERCLKRGKQDG